MRETDRKKNGMASFPKLYYPELYILKGGYNAFYPRYPVCDFHLHTVLEGGEVPSSTAIVFSIQWFSGQNTVLEEVGEVPSSITTVFLDYSIVQWSESLEGALALCIVIMYVWLMTLLGAL